MRCNKVKHLFNLTNAPLTASVLGQTPNQSQFVRSRAEFPRETPTSALPTIRDLAPLMTTSPFIVPDRALPRADFSPANPSCSGLMGSYRMQSQKTHQSLDLGASIRSLMGYGVIAIGTVMLRRFLAVFVIVGLQTASARALDPAKHISQYGHTAWRMQDGAFNSAPETIAQTPDGYIWIGTSDGILQFDGLHFVRWTPGYGQRLPNSEVLRLSATASP